MEKTIIVGVTGDHKPSETLIPINVGTFLYFSGKLYVLATKMSTELEIFFRYFYSMHNLAMNTKSICNIRHINIDISEVIRYNL